MATNGVNTDVDSGLQSGDSPTFAGLNVSSGTGSFGRIEATAITASRVDVDSGTIAVGGQPINATLVQNISSTFSSTEAQDSTTVTGSFGRVEQQSRKINMVSSLRKSQPNKLVVRLSLVIQVMIHTN